MDQLNAKDEHRTAWTMLKGDEKNEDKDLFVVYSVLKKNTFLLKKN